MTSNLAPDPDASALDRTCSSSCTRAGIAVLIFSAVAFSMLPTLTQVPALNAFGRYAALRTKLKVEFGLLDNDPCWQALPGTSLADQATDKWTIPALKQQPCVYSAPPVKQSPHTPTTPATEPAPNAPPPAPLGLSVTMPLTPGVGIAESLAGLADRNNLDLARGAPLKYELQLSIYKWTTLLNQLIFKNMSRRFRMAGRPGDGVYWDSNPRDLPLKLSLADQAQNFLTLADVRRLADYELPDVNEVERIIAERARVTLPMTAAMPLSLSTGVMLVEFGLFLSLIYFSLFQREAERSAKYPAPGTLFAIFSRTRASRTLFVILVCIPAIAAILLAWWAPVSTVKAAAGVIAGLVLIVCVSVRAGGAERRVWTGR